MVPPRYPVTDIRTWLTDGVSKVFSGACEAGFAHALLHTDLYKIDDDGYWNIARDHVT